jgi:hypothetical protein
MAGFDETMRCPHCDREIRAGATVCKFCREDVGPAGGDRLDRTVASGDETRRVLAGRYELREKLGRGVWARCGVRGIGRSSRTWP